MAIEEICHEDQETLLRMAGEISQEKMEEFRIEYLIRLRMLHREGLLGRMGPLAMLDCLRSVGIGPPAAPSQAKESEIDWRSVEVNSQVDVFHGGRVYQGRFVGLGDGGMLYVRLDKETYVREFTKFDVSTRASEMPADISTESLTSVVEQEDKDKYDEISKRFEAIEKKRREQLSTPVQKGKQDFQSHAPRDPEGNEQFDWLSVEAGIPVWIQQGQEWVDGQFVDLADQPGQLTVMLHGEESPLDVPEGSVKVA